MKTIITAFKTALSGLRANRGRTALTVLGIVIGIALVIIVMASGAALEVFITNQISSFGTDFLEVEVKVPGTLNPVGVTITTLTTDDAEAIIEHENISTGYSGMMSQVALTYGGETKKAIIFGVSAEFPEIDPIEIEEGRFYDAQEEASIARVVVLGKKMKEKLFGQSDAVGQSIRVDNARYRVIGVAKERGSMAFFDFDDLVYIPLKTVQKVISGVNYVSFIITSLIDTDKSAETKLDIQALMRERHKIPPPDPDEKASFFASGEKDDFIVSTMAEAQEIIGVVLTAIQWLLIALASISLVVGGVGIMNIMYVSVSERTYEIGLRKAIGAKNKSIMLQFLTEAVVITGLGGVVGIIIGAIIAFAIAIVAQLQGFDWPFIISLQSILIAVGFSVAVGIIFGLYPARKASKLNPIQALRYE